MKYCLSNTIRSAAAVVLLTGLLNPIPSALGQAAVKLPTAKEVVAKYVEALGGREAILKTSAARAGGKFEMNNAGQLITADLELLRAAPNKQLVRVNAEGFEQVVSGFDGTNGWLIMPMGAGPMLLQGKMLDQARDDAVFYNQLHEEKNYRSMTVVGVTQIDGSECYEMKSVFKSGRETTEYFDTKSGLLVGIRTTQENPQGSIEITSKLSEYKKFGGVLQPTKLTQKLVGADQTITLTNISNDPIPSKEFEMPEEVKALLKDQPAK